jgi:predicted dithiol-disulfide oxidoreductase (DUF899 family)
MTEHSTGTRHEWEAARRALLEREKELTRMGDELAVERAALPWVPVEAEYTFDTEEGTKTLAELFGSNSQLIVYHFMFGPDWDEGCKSCSAMMDHIEVPRVHLEHHDVSFVAVSRAPLDKLLGYRSRMGWSFPWVSSFGSDFNFDFQVSTSDERPLREYNFRAIPDEVLADLPSELPGMSCFALRDGLLFHTYSAYARGLDAMLSMFQWFDRAPLGRNEPDGGMSWLRRHDSYEAAVS